MSKHSEFAVVSIRSVKVGEMFLPIERMGEYVYVTAKRRWERKWKKADKSYVSTGMARGVDENGNDGVFSLFDFAVVRRPKTVTFNSGGSKIERLLNKWGTRHG